jgi:flagellar L-ring protein precursor FlgH
MKATRFLRIGMLAAGVGMPIFAISDPAFSQQPITFQIQEKPTFQPAASTETAGPATPRPSGSLFQTTSSSSVNLFSDFKAQQVGDVVFIDVFETTSASMSSAARRKRDSGGLAGAIIAAAPLPTTIAGAAGAAAGAISTRSFEGTGSTERQSNLRTRIAAQVVEVLPNGDLRIEARKNVKLNKEDETMTLRGIVRRRDIQPDNTVSSLAVGDLKLQLNGKGFTSANANPGWLARFLDKISPF